jgi:two-component system phosphate regulon sensor histidine kinase PhoR
MEPEAGGSGPSRRRLRRARSIAQSQLVVAAEILFLIALATVVVPDALGDPLFFAGVLLMFLVTAIAILFPWDGYAKGWAMLLPLADILSMGLIREGLPLVGTGLFLVLPVLWLARNFRLIGAISGPLLGSALLWTSWAAHDRTPSTGDLAESLLLPITLAILSTMTYATSRRTEGQRNLLRQQAAVIENAFARARRQERLLDEILNAVEFGVIAFDLDGDVTLTNAAHRRSLEQFGAPRSAVVHPTAYQADRVTPHPEDSRPFARAVAGQAFENIVIWVGDPGDNQAALSVTASALTAPDGEREGGVVVVRNVTTELEAIRTRDDLVGSVSHELNTPLTSIIGYLELALDDGTLSDETRRMIDIAHRNAGRMLGLVTDLLRAGTGPDASLSMEFERCDIVEIVRSSIDAQRLVADARGITVSEVFPPSAPTNADPLRIRQVVDNLLTNAIKYNRDAGSIVTTVEVGEGTISLKVADTGHGISKIEQSRLFDRFYRTESARRSSTTGTGLGLSITREIVRQHGGQLLVESEPGVGSVFEMRLPASVVR